MSTLGYSASWTRFWDMHSGGYSQLIWTNGMPRPAPRAPLGVRAEPGYELSYIYINLPLYEARAVFKRLFGIDPTATSCNCCGPDSFNSLEQASGYHRNCRWLQVPSDPVSGQYHYDDPVILQHYYIEDGEEPPEGYEINSVSDIRIGQYLPVSAYIERPDVLVLYAHEINRFAELQHNTTQQQQRQ